MTITEKSVVDADFRGEIMVIMISNDKMNNKAWESCKINNKQDTSNWIEIIEKLNETTRTEKNKCSEEKGVLAYQTDGDTIILQTTNVKLHFSHTTASSLHSATETSDQAKILRHPVFQIFYHYCRCSLPLPLTKLPSQSLAN